MIDHVTVAGRDLKALDSAFAEAGLPSEYGGAHSNGVTHMSLVAFGDGSYIELISTLEGGATSPLWPRHVSSLASPAAWCIGSDHLADQLEGVRGRGIAVRGPVPMTRTRADGVQLEWDLGFLGDGEPGAVLPFLIQDRTDRAQRVSPSERVAGSGLAGVAAVVIGCHQAGETAKVFSQALGWPDVSGGPRTVDAATGMKLFSVPGKPVVFAEPTGEGSWLARRLEQVGESPCAFLLRSDQWRHSESRLRFAGHSQWFGERVHWLRLGDFADLKVGVVKG